MEPTPEIKFARREAVALGKLLALGVTLGEPVEEEDADFGCTSCVFHLFNSDFSEEPGDPGNVDGAPAYVLLTNYHQNYYGPAEKLTIRPVVPKGTLS